MARSKRGPEPQVEEDPAFQHGMWRVERIGWVAIALLLLAGLLGLFGPGPLSSTAAGDEQLRVEYRHFDRYKAPATLRFRIDPDTARGGELRLWLDRAYLEGVQVQQVTPQPEHAEVRGNRVVYVFRAGKSDSPAVVTFHLTHQQMGPLKGRTGVEGGPEVTFDQFIYP